LDAWRRRCYCVRLFHGAGHFLPPRTTGSPNSRWRFSVGVQRRMVRIRSGRRWMIFTLDTENGFQRAVPALTASYGFGDKRVVQGAV